jgi:hypothetical protein
VSMGYFGEGRPLADDMYQYRMGFPDGAPEGNVTFAITMYRWQKKAIGKHHGICRGNKPR